jgi:hypothetical protein
MSNLKSAISEVKATNQPCSVVIGSYDRSLLNQMVVAFNFADCHPLDAHDLEPRLDENIPLPEPLPQGVTIHWVDSPYGRSITHALMDSKLDVHRPDNKMPSYVTDKHTVAIEIGRGSPWKD